MVDSPYGELSQIGEDARWQWTPRWWAWPLAAVVIFAAAAAGVLASPPGSSVAVWWPAAGLSVLFALLNPGRRRWAVVALVLVVTGAANVAAGRPLPLSIVFAIGNAAEVAIIVSLLMRGPARFRLRSSGRALRFILAAVAGALTLGVIAATGSAVLAGGDFASVFLQAATSHAAAVLLVAPFAALPAPTPTRASTPEIILQAVLLAASVFIVFAPAAYLVLSFVPFALVVWAAVRFPPPVVLTETLLTGIAILVLGRAGGPLASTPLLPSERGFVVALFVVGLAVVGLLLVAARTEVRAATRTATNLSRLLEGGFLDTQVGLLIAEQRDGPVRILWANRAALRMLADEIGNDGIWRGDVADQALTAVIDGSPTPYRLSATGTVISVIANRVPDDRDRFVAQFVDITGALRATETQLAAEQERAAALSARLDLERQREDFLATTSHELRTPITSIVGYVELLSESPYLTETERGWVEVIQRNASRLAYLVEDVLTLSGLAAGPAAPAPTSIRVADLVGEALTEHRPSAASRDVHLADEIPAEHTVWAAPRDVGRILTNLVSNALKFTPAGGTITVRSITEDGRTAIEVLDTGPGMPPDVLEHAFDRFYRGPDAEARNTPGAGLGLAIVAELAERNGGTVTLANRHGGGLRATVALPATAPQPAAPGPATGSRSDN